MCWTDAAARLTRGQDAPGDSGEVAGLGAAGLTLTFGLGAGLFSDRYGLAGRRPEALADLPGFNGDQLVAERSGGDLSLSRPAPMTLRWRSMPCVNWRAWQTCGARAWTQSAPRRRKATRRAT